MNVYVQFEPSLFVMMRLWQFCSETAEISDINIAIIMTTMMMTAGSECRSEGQSAGVRVRVHIDVPHPEQCMHIL